MNQKVIALVDGNNFFVSCETAVNPSLKGKPVCVLSNNDGCIIARSNEAKKLGVKMGMPYFMAKRDFSGIIYLSSNFSLYHDLSMRMMKVLKNYSDKIDIYSIDEAFLDLSGTDRIFNLSYRELAQKIRDDIAQTTGLSVSAGISCTKMLAKLAAAKAKQRNGCYIIEKHLIEQELTNIDIEEIWGIGKKLSKSLRQRGIFYAHEILLKDDNFYKRTYGKRGLELKYELSGISVMPVTGAAEKPKSIQRTRAFPEFSSDKRYILTEIEIHLHNVCRKLREYNMSAKLISVMLRTKDFKLFFKEQKLVNETNCEILLIDKIKVLFNDIFKDGIIYRSSGVYAGCLKDLETVSLNLFGDDKKEKCSALSFLIDNIEAKYGKGAICFGDSGIKKIQNIHKRKIRFR